MQFSHKLLALAALVPSFVSAQSQDLTSCNPLNTTKTCPADTALGIANYNISFTNMTSLDTTIWDQTSGVPTFDQNNGATFTIAQQGDSPTIQSNFYIFFGSVSIIMRAAPGAGIVSSIVLLSDDLDEVDWEWIGGNNTHVETNYFGKDNTTSYDRAVWFPINNPQGTFHNYTTVWTSSSIQWIIDGTVVRTLPYAAANNGNNFPQTPMHVRLGNWAGGDPTLNSEGTVQWAGGPVNYKQAPFNMYIKSMTVSDGTLNAATYTYDGTTGSFGSIKVASGNSSIANYIYQQSLPKQSAIQQAESAWNKMSTAAHIGIIVGASVVGSLLLLCCTICCIRGRRAEKRQRFRAEEEYAALEAETRKHFEDILARRQAQEWEMEKFGAKNGSVTVTERYLVNEGDRWVGQ